MFVKSCSSPVSQAITTLYSFNKSKAKRKNVLACYSSEGLNVNDEESKSKENFLPRQPSRSLQSDKRITTTLSPVYSEYQASYDPKPRKIATDLSERRAFIARQRTLAGNLSKVKLLPTKSDTNRDTRGPGFAPLSALPRNSSPTFRAEIYIRDKCTPSGK